ncbi:MAG: hypothetical protein ABJG78_17245 [Cyclobacteriaceae bacterium]
MKTTLLTIAILIAMTSNSQSIMLDDVYPEEVASEGFTLTSNSNVKIEGIGSVFYEDWKAIVYYGWIIDSKTRKVVWHLFDEMKDQDFRESDGQIDFNVDVDLKKGDYEAYFAAAYSNGNDWNDWGNTWAVKNFNDVVNKIFDSRDRQKYRSSYSDDFYMRVSSENLRKVDMSELLNKNLSNSILSFNRMGDSESEKKGFSLTSETDVRVYSIGEGSRGETFDYLWIYDARTREVVFELEYDNTDFAGGAEKNLKFDEIITLDAGDYIASYSSDGSHSYEKWNALPPDDPQFWGATIWPASESDSKNVVAFREPKTLKPLVDLTRVRDDELLSKGFSIKREMDVRVLCLGEEGSDGMADYGWIMNANTRDKVWQMKEYRSDHAGGASKNRKVSEVITLPAGDYIVYYSTDGSHAYNDWNSTRPHEEEMWGITIWATDESDLRNVTAFEPSEFVNKNSLVEILMVRDDEYIRESFTLDEDTDVRILAIGEGSDGDMHDYGYIRDESGRTVWEMEYRDSDHAGGSSKNREFNERLTLRKGTYRVTYRSDGSHSYGRWNASPPSDPEMWGLQIVKE